MVIFFLFFVFVVYDLKKWLFSLLYSLFILSPKALETILLFLTLYMKELWNKILFPMFYATKPLKCVLFVFVVFSFCFSQKKKLPFCLRAIFL